ncbi:MAG: phospholipase D family protein [Phycisphaerae bacterium]|nr:phospholipase D family protein [Phycisphaerae bacterium]
MVQLLLNYELHRVLGLAIASTRHRIFISTADLKNVQLPMAARAARCRSLLSMLDDLAKRGVEVRVLHSGIPSGPFLQELKRCRADGVAIRRCPRVHAKAVIIDGRQMYIGSANLTGAGLGAKSPRRRNFESGILTEDLSLIDPMIEMLESVWDGTQCEQCGRKKFCPLPLEEPAHMRNVEFGMRN